MLPPFQYALRRTLPPWSLKWRLKMLESVIDSWRLDEIVLNIDAEEFNHAQLSMEWLDHYLPMLEEAKRRLEAQGARVSFNPWCTVCHHDNGRSGAEIIPDFQGMVDIGGEVSPSCSCQLSRSWRDHIGKIWRRYAALHPYAIWLDTDLRHFSHGLIIRYGCFCEAHLRRFSERAGLGRIVSREELRTALLKEGEPHPWRRLWLEMQGEETNGTVALLREAVQAVSPETRLGLIPGGPRDHCMEGRDWKGLRRALSGSPQAPYVSRPFMGVYTEITPLNLYGTADSIALTRKLLPDAEWELASLENFPYSRINRSLATTRAEMLLTAVAGSEGVTLSLFDAFGNPMEAADKVGAMLREMKPRLMAVSQMRRSPGRDRGINIAFADDYGKTRHSDGSGNIEQLAADGGSCATLLGLLGIPWVYDDEAPITILTGETARAIPDALILKCLSGGLWLDAPAATILQERGFGDFLGVSHFQPPVPPSALHNAAGEEFLPATIPPRYDSLFVPNFGVRSTITLLTPAEGAQPFSRAVDNDGRPLGCTGTLFRNKLGGRVFVHAFVYDPHARSVAFSTPPRLEAFSHMLAFLDGGTGAIPLRLTGDGVCAYPLRRDLDDGRVLVGFMNFSNDPWDELTFHLPDGEEYNAADTLEGISWLPYPQPLDLRDGQWSLRRRVAPKEAFFALLHRKGGARAEPLEILEVDGGFAEADFPLATCTMERIDTEAAGRLADFRRHRHVFHELLLVHGGKARLDLDGEETGLADGDLLLLRPRTAHALAAPEAPSLTMVRFAPERLPLLDDLMAALPDSAWHARLRQPERQRAAEQLRQIKEALESSRPDRKLAALTALAHLLTLLAPTGKDADGSEEAQLLARLDKAVQLMEEQYGRRLTVEELADSANASVRNFQRLFAQAFGTSPMEHLQDIRLYHAEQMLTQGRLTIAEIAAECGFTKPSRFATLFRHKFGVTPQQYRKGAR